jgi:hypothetical protein
MESSLALGTRDIRSALILCLLTICFESWNGDIQSAVTQVRIGLKLIQEWQSERSIADLADKELILAFYRLDNDSMMFIDEEPIVIDLSYHQPSQTVSQPWKKQKCISKCFSENSQTG